MTTENYDKATKLLESLARDEDKLTKLKEISGLPDGYNPTRQNHKVTLLDKDKRHRDFYLEVFDPKMVTYLIKQEMNLLNARITKNRILLSKL